jgi:hypothetical protein
MKSTPIRRLRYSRRLCCLFQEGVMAGFSYLGSAPEFVGWAEFAGSPGPRRFRVDSEVACRKRVHQDSEAPSSTPHGASTSTKL